MKGLRKFKLDVAVASPVVKAGNDNRSDTDVEKGRKLTALFIDVSGIIQSEFLASKCGRQADLLLEFRYLIGQIFDIPVIEMNAPELKLDIARQIQQL